MSNVKTQKKVTEFQAVADTIIRMIDDNYTLTNTFDPARILVAGICNSLHDFFIPNAEEWEEKMTDKVQALNEYKSTKKEQDQEIAGDTQTRQDKINLQDAIENTRENLGTAQEELTVANKKVKQLKLMLTEMAHVYELTFKETWIPKNEQKTSALPKRLSK